MDRKVVGAVVAAMALAAGGCGSSSKPLTRAEFVTRAEAACRHAQQIVNRRGPPSRGPEDFVNRLLAGLKAESNDLGKLTPPKNLQATFAAFKQDLAQFQDLAKRYGAAAKARDTKQMEAISRAATPITNRRTAHIRSLGLRTCS
jgi:hypothetical protein